MREGLREGGGGGGGVGGERLRQLDGALYAGRQEGDPGRSWSWYRWSYLEQYLHDDAISAMSWRENEGNLHHNIIISQLFNSTHIEGF